MVNTKKRIRVLKILATIVLPIIILVVYYFIAVQVNPPKIDDLSATKLTRKTVSPNFYTCDNSWLKQNKYGLWELYLEGNDFDLGVKNGILAKELVQYQEEAFVKMIKGMVPSESNLGFLKYFIAWFDRNIDEYIPLEYQREIYGVSLSASHEFDYISTPYHRMLNYHGAHDIGHAVQNMGLVACTAFGVKDNRSTDSSLLIGRNMDFYAGDDFAINKIVAFYKPQKGYKFSTISWGGMIGVISGMNDQGLTVTLNSASAKIPFSAKTPVSILARHILQYASTIDEALKIANETEIFVAESFLISSAKDNDFAVIEKTPDETELYHENSDAIILTNHYQSAKLIHSEKNRKNMTESASVYRWNRVKELMDRTQKHDVSSFVKILRDQKGLGDLNIGMANEKAVNQLIAHHSILFKPKELKFWVSTSPYQIGNYVAYDLHKVFSDTLNIYNEVYDSQLTVPVDSFLYSTEYKSFVEYKAKTFEFEKNIKSKSVASISNDLIEGYLLLNPEFFYPYFLAGEIYQLKGEKELALKNYNVALSKEIPKIQERDRVLEAIESLKEE